MFLVRIAPRFRRGFFLLGRSAGIPAGVLVFGGIGFSLSSFLLSIPKLNSKETFMSSLKAVGRSTAARKVGRLTATNKTDRVSLCTFTFSDGRRCRTPRVRNNAHFCFYHAQTEARARTAQKLGKDLACFFFKLVTHPSPFVNPDPVGATSSSAIAAHSLASHERRIRSASTGWS